MRERSLETDPLSDGPSEAHAFERRLNHLPGAVALRVAGRLGMQQLGVREDDAELVIQAVKEALQICRFEGLVITLERNF